ncbi:MAG: GNAT family N-acetyltransferase [Ignavibacteriae bacterium]|nr:GNAT family N-acetyltransferase [Ignavibacteriota bacterium]
MKFPDKYLTLKDNIFKKNEYSIVPIRYKDRNDIMRWRNEQIYHLRQTIPLTHDDQEHYFKIVVSKLFDQKHPDQILFSFLKNDKCIGYGGLVHISWIDRNAEISFIMDTRLEKNEFQLNWKIFLELIEKVAFDQLNLYKLYTYAFDLRPQLYSVLESVGYNKEAVLKSHCFFEKKFINVVIHSKFNYENSI